MQACKLERTPVRIQFWKKFPIARHCQKLQVASPCLSPCWGNRSSFLRIRMENRTSITQPGTLPWSGKRDMLQRSRRRLALQCRQAIFISCRDLPLGIGPDQGTVCACLTTRAAAPLKWLQAPQQASPHVQRKSPDQNLRSSYQQQEPYLSPSQFHGADVGRAISQPGHKQRARQRVACQAPMMPVEPERRDPEFPYGLDVA